MQGAEADIFQVIADASRREMLHLLSLQTMTINEIAENFDMSRPAVSKHLKLLHQAGFIVINDVGRERKCTLNEAGFRALKDWMNYYDKFWTHKISALTRLIDTNKMQENGNR